MSDAEKLVTLVELGEREGIPPGQLDYLARSRGVSFSRRVGPVRMYSPEAAQRLVNLAKEMNARREARKGTAAVAA